MAGPAFKMDCHCHAFGARFVFKPLKAGHSFGIQVILNMSMLHTRYFAEPDFQPTQTSQLSSELLRTTTQQEKKPVAPTDVSQQQSVRPSLQPAHFKTMLKQAKRLKKTKGVTADVRILNACVYCQ
jgi:hypothetical protein